MAKPIIAAINGPVFTGGLEMALGCDFLIASQRAVFADTHARVGILPGGGMTARLPQLVGGAMARRLSMTGEVIDAASRRADRTGHRSRPARSAAGAGVELASQITEVPAPIMAGLKEIYVTGSATVTDPALAAEQDIAGAQQLDRDGLGDRYTAISERNRRQIRPRPKKKRAVVGRRVDEIHRAIELLGQRRTVLCRTQHRLAEVQYFFRRRMRRIRIGQVEIIELVGCP